MLSNGGRYLHESREEVREGNPDHHSPIHTSARRGTRERLER
jgi:hypothetical protein